MFEGETTSPPKAMTPARAARATAAATAILAAVLIGSCGASRSSDSGRVPELPESFAIRMRADVPLHMSVVAAPLETVAGLVPAAYQNAGLPVARASGRAELIFITPNLRISGQLYEGERNSDYIDCGASGPGGERADLYEVEFAMMTRLSDSGDGATRVESLLDGRAYRRAASGALVHCHGTGRLERMIADFLRARAAAGE